MDIFLVVWVLTMVVLGAGILVGMQKRPHYPVIDPSDVLFRENFASSEFSRNCLQVIITRQEIWTRLPVPALSRLFNLENRIPRASLLSFQEEKGSFGTRYVKIRWEDDSGLNQTMQLIVRRPEALLEALNTLKYLAKGDTIRDLPASQ